jgi:hypothetical protein
VFGIKGQLDEIFGFGFYGESTLLGDKQPANIKGTV